MYIDCMKHKLAKGGDKLELKSWTVRVPENIVVWVRETAARRTIKEGRAISMNKVFVEILTKAMEADTKKGGKDA